MISFFIPIRKGSKRIKNKNFKSLPGYKFGLTEIKVLQLLKFKKILKKLKIKRKFEFIISTNCEKTIKFLKPYKWIKLHIRLNKDAMDDSMDRLIKIVPKVCAGKHILWTHVTSPFFNENNYLDFVNTFLKSKYKSAFSANKVQKFLFSKKRGWISHNASNKKWPRTQDLETIYVANSAAFIADRNIYKFKKNRVDKNPLPIISDFGSSLDIDDYKDFQNLKKNLKNIKLKKF
jgi:CMP-N-acetylneuraminic acid synthetase